MRKFWPKPRFWGKIFQRYWLKSRFSENFDQDHNFPTILTKIVFFMNFDQNRYFRKSRVWISFTKIDIFANFDQNRHFSEILTKTKISGKFYRRYWLKSRFSENVDQDHNFPTTLIKVEIFENIDQIREFCQFLPKSIFV